MKMGLLKNSIMEEVNIQKEEIEEHEVGRLLYFGRPSIMGGYQVYFQSNAGLDIPAYH